MNKLTLVFAVLLLVLAAGAAGAQEAPPVLVLSTGRTDADGVISPDEYTLTVTLPRAVVSLKWSEQTLCVGVTAPTAGWVALGLGSRKMDGALIVMGYRKGDLAQLKIQKGAGHGHGDTPSDAMLSYAVGEKGVSTTVEVVLKAGSVVAAGQTGLDMIIAFGATDSFAGFHRWRSPLSVSLAR
jgi:hypothetical protein